MRSPGFGEVVTLDMSMITGKFTPLNPRQSPLAMLSEEQVVVESPMAYEAPVGSLDVSPASDRVVQLLPLESQVSLLWSIQLSPNRVCEDFD